jgi:hypothetical protein
MVTISIPELETQLEAMNASLDDEGNAKHWHVVLFKDPDGHIRWLLSKPEIHEIDITDKILK